MPRKTIKEQVLANIVGGPVSFKATTEEHALIMKCAERAADESIAMHGALVPRKELIVDFAMDLSATNANGCPLDLEKLLSFDKFNFWHDVGGIRRHLDRDTGKLTRCFLPRCAR